MTRKCACTQVFGSHHNPMCELFGVVSESNYVHPEVLRSAPSMKEAKVEKALNELESYGFEVVKLKTPGTSGVMDRLILMPKWSPAPPAFVELKRPGKSERPLQAAVRDDWRARGCDVRDMCDTVEAVKRLCAILLIEAVERKSGLMCELPVHIICAYTYALNDRSIR